MRTPAERTAKVLAACAEIGFDDAGIARADGPLFGAEVMPDAAASGRLAILPYLETSAADRADVGRFLEGARSVVVVVQRYYRGDHADLDAEATAAGGAKVSRYAWGSDYHNIIRKRLRRLRKRLLRELDDDDDRWAPFCDTEAVLERAWAQAAGLGFVGKSAMFIHHRSVGVAGETTRPSFGTWVFLGGLATTAELAPTTPVPPVTDGCGSCRRCLDACPTDAFDGPFALDIKRCLTTWSVERPLDDPDPTLAADLEGHGWAVGCDVCQEVCPYNRWATVADDERFAPRAGLVALLPPTVPDDAQLVGSPLARPGREGLQRSVTRALKVRDR
jgi:epoxyqueuosine reductase